MIHLSFGTWAGLINLIVVVARTPCLFPCANRPYSLLSDLKFFVLFSLNQIIHGIFSPDHHTYVLPLVGQICVEPEDILLHDLYYLVPHCKDHILYGVFVVLLFVFISICRCIFTLRADVISFKLINTLGCIASLSLNLVFSVW